VKPQTPSEFQILVQPDDTTCGPTCLHAVYKHYGDEVPLDLVMAETRMLREGGTLASLLGIHALRRGYKVTIHPFNLDIWDPTWFQGEVDLVAKLRAQQEFEPDETFRFVTNRYIEFIELGGRIEFVELTARLLRAYLKQGLPILTMLSATYLYMEPREIWATGQADDVRGEPAGHFVIIFGLDDDRRYVTIADPLGDDQPFGSHIYRVKCERLIGAILLGVLSYDSALLIIEPGSPARRLGSPGSGLRGTSDGSGRLAHRRNPGGLAGAGLAGSISPTRPGPPVARVWGSHHPEGSQGELSMIELRDLRKAFGPVVAVDRVSLKVERGEVLGFLGPNGAGKSTTMKMVTGFLTPTSGTAIVAGHDVRSESLAVRRVLGYLPEGAPAYPT